jgi:hypothetical protein
MRPFDAKSFLQPTLTSRAVKVNVDRCQLSGQNLFSVFSGFCLRKSCASPIVLTDSGAAIRVVRKALWQIEHDNLPCHVRDPNKVLEPYLIQNGASISVIGRQAFAGSRKTSIGFHLYHKAFIGTVIHGITVGYFFFHISRDSIAKKLSSKHQHPSSKEIPSTNLSNGVRSSASLLDVGIWCFSGGWSLALGAFIKGC